MVNVDRHIAINAGWIAGPAFGIAMMAAPEYLHPGPIGSALLFWGGISVFVVTVIVVMVISLHEDRKRKAVTGPIILMALGALIFCAGAAWYFWPHEEKSSSKEISPSDVLPTSARTTDHVPNRTERFGDVALLSNRDLARLTRQFSSEMRIFEVNSRSGSEIPDIKVDLTLPKEKLDEIFQERHRQLQKQSDQRRLMFRERIFLDMTALYRELAERLQKRGIMIPEPYIGVPAEQSLPALNGSLAGPHPITAVADQLDRMARKLPD